jgi:SWI/SNF-related matrix-associated actin-dependent regulator 1 of chromatin subfamily A
MPLELSAEQIEGAQFLAERRVGFLFDEPGFGKTAQAVTAADIAHAENILFITTASARANVLNEWRMWSSRPNLPAYAAFSGSDTIPARAEVVAVSWAGVAALKEQLVARRWDAVVLDEAHYAANIVSEAGDAVARTLAVLGAGGITSRAKQVWCLTGTPIPNTPDDLFPLLRSLVPQRLLAQGGTPDVSKYEAFKNRYAVWAQKPNGMRPTFIGGQNQAELNARLAGLYLRRKLTNLPPIRHSMYAVHSNEAVPLDYDDAAVLAAAESGDTEWLDMHMGTVLRLTGRLKAGPIAESVRDELRNGLDRIVLFYVHTEVGDILRERLNSVGVVGIEGRTLASARQRAVDDFQAGRARVFLAQLQAAGEAITLTKANQCLFVEASFRPKDMTQAIRRIYRRTQTRPCICRIAALAGSIDEALARVVVRKQRAIREIME